MKNYKKLLIFIICIILTGFAGSMIIVQKSQNREVDISALNDIVQTARENMDDINRMREYDFGVGYVIYDAKGSAIFVSEKNDAQNSGSEKAGFYVPLHYTDAVRDGYPCMMIAEAGNLYGSAALLNSPGTGTKKMIMSSLGALMFSGLCLIICAILWGIYVKHSIVKPFLKMEQFAGEVASGNLDAPLQMDRSNMFGAFTESFDIMREELAKAKKTELDLRRQEKEMVASLSHDLKTPITGIKLTAELMQAQANDAGTKEKLGNIYKKAERIDSLVNDLFTSTLKDLGEMNVNVSDENSLLLHEFVKRCDDKKKAKETVIPQCLISIDTKRMEQIIGNIFVNSYKYADSPIDITYSIIEGYLKMSIRDYGPGVPEDEIKLITNKFYRSRASRDEKTEGSGLGLYIAKMLIEKMNGEIRCLNAEPGFEVMLLIPLS